MSYLTLGVIGHVDHGKSTLVKALTGTETDRLKEEKERGISIALGYAHLSLPSGDIGIIDAPGHERFIRTMIAGATGSASVLLVVDVNEGVKPQTIEHLAIAGLLGMQRGVIAITKCDTADPELLPLVKEEIRELVVDSFMEEAPLLETSAVEEAGLDDLRAALDDLLKEAEPILDEHRVYLPIDRVFSMDGFGTVLTGTLRRGTLAVDDKVALYPGGAEASIRALQSHQETVDHIDPGHRCAVNLRGVDRDTLERGNVLATPNSVTTGTSLGVQLTLLQEAAAPVKHGQALRMLFGTQKCYPHVYFLDRKTLDPGETTVAELRHDAPIVALHQEPFILRSYSPMHTIGGGRVLEVRAEKYRRKGVSVVGYLEQLAGGDPETIIRALGEASPTTPLRVSTVQDYARVDAKTARDILNTLSVTWITDDTVMLTPAYAQLADTMTVTLEKFHAENPTRPGIPEGELNDHLPTSLDASLFQHLLDNLVTAQTILIQKGHISLSTFTVAGALSEKDKQRATEIEETFKSRAFKPPDLKSVIAGDDARHKIYRYLVDTEVLVPARDRVQNATIVFHRDTIQEAKERLANEFPGDALFSASEARTTLDTTRKYIIPLLEYLDSVRFTRRNGDKRQVIV